jgi:type IV pilus assembly protein PilE
MNLIARSRGMTLVELMVVLLIVLILATLAYPAYTSFVVRAVRVEGQVALLDRMQQQERYYTRTNTYIPFSSASTEPDEKEFRWWSGSTAAESGYELSGRACPDVPLERCIELRAEPGTTLVNANFRDEQCATLVLVSTGQHYATGPQARCWP